MTDAFRIAVVSTNATALVAMVEALAGSPQTQGFADLFTDAAAVLRFRPDALFLQQAGFSDADSAALRLLQSLLPGLAVVLVCPRAHEASLAGAAKDLGVVLLTEPFTLAELAGLTTAIEERRPHDAVESMHDLARGVADEINNPLLSVSGHLQLLAQHLADDPDRRRQVESMRQGLRRIQASVDKLTLLSRAANGARRSDAVDLAGLLREVTTTLADGPQLRAPPPVAWVRGDADLLRAALSSLCGVGRVLAAATADAELELLATPAGAVTRLALAGDLLADWRLPRSFEPYYLNRILRGTVHGLDLFLVQTITETHGGKALARRDRRQRVLLELHLPAVAPPAASTGVR